MKEIYFVRHGQSQANARNAYAGWDDVGLTDMGREQAKAVASVIKDLDIDAIICSDLSRSHETANIIADSIDFKGEVRVDPRLREVGLEPPPIRASRNICCRLPTASTLWGWSRLMIAWFEREHYSKMSWMIQASGCSWWAMEALSGFCSWW
jgi:hypothetical protein